MSLLAEVQRLLRSGREQIGRRRLIGEQADAVRRAYGQRLDALEREMARAYERGAQEGKRQGGLDRLGREISDLDGLPHARQRTLDLLTEMAAEQRRVLVMVDREARLLGLSPSRRLDLLRAVGGLNRRQAETLLRRHRAMLEAGQPHRVLRRNLVAEGERARAYRASMIARTEAAVANNQGREAAWRVGRDLGLLPPSVRRVWRTTLDERTCPTCSALDGVSIPFDSTWDAAGKAVTSPGEVHPHCRCFEELEVGPARRVA